MKTRWIRLNLVRFGDIAALAGIAISLLAVAARILGISAILTVGPFSYFVGGLWLMVLGALIRLETLLTVGKEKTFHPEFAENVKSGI